VPVALLPMVLLVQASSVIQRSQCEALSSYPRRCHKQNNNKSNKNNKKQTENNGTTKTITTKTIKTKTR
jgi:hypothetical protein